MRARMLDRNRIEKLRRELELALQEQVKAHAKAEALSETLSLLEAQTYLEHEFSGKNAETRQAEAIALLSMSEAVSTARAALREAQRDEAIAKARVEIAIRDIQMWIAAAREGTRE